jgi:hypothetical protein
VSADNVGSSVRLAHPKTFTRIAGWGGIRSRGIERSEKQEGHSQPIQGTTTYPNDEANKLPCAKWALLFRIDRTCHQSMFRKTRRLFFVRLVGKSQDS